MITTDVKKDFGAAIREHRRRLGMSQEALAERAELHRTYITDVERGARNLSLESISKLARALEISLGALFTSMCPRSGEGYSGPSASAQAAHLLLVEDDPKDVELAIGAFQRAKLANPLDVARDGAEALDLLFARGAYERRQVPVPSIVLLDIGLPKVPGMEVLRRIKSDERTRRIHVVMLTGSRSDDLLQEALQLGADAYIVKPVDFVSLSAVTPQLNFYWTLLTRNGKLQ
jgi:CheY-like chemotaxis protein/DNA-binding XRE family transcriptional regulator